MVENGILSGSWVNSEQESHRDQRKTNHKRRVSYLGTNWSVFVVIDLN